MPFLSDFSLKPYNTFGIEALAPLYAEFNSADELNSLLSASEIKNKPLMILGGGSNVLLTKNPEGVILRNLIKGIELVKEDSSHIWVKAGSGVVWHDLVLHSISKGWAGLENLSLIPGTVGAAPMQNIGAYGVEIKDVFDSLEALRITTLQTETFDLNQCKFGYRESVFKRDLKGLYIITSVTFRLFKQPRYNTSYGAIAATLDQMGVKELSIKAVSDAVIHIRRSKLPDPATLGNAGSFFKNPEISLEQYNQLKAQHAEIPSYPASSGKVKVPAGWLIEQSGWKGKMSASGHCGVHKMQALVIVNYGNASGKEIHELSEEVKKSVKEKFGVELETEVNII